MLKKNFPVGFVNASTVLDEKKIFNQLWNLLQFRGNVFRSKTRGKMEVSRKYKCHKCNNTTVIYADRLTGFHFETSDRCIPTRGCKDSMTLAEDPAIRRKTISTICRRSPTFANAGNIEPTKRRRRPKKRRRKPTKRRTKPTRKLSQSLEASDRRSERRKPISKRLFIARNETQKFQRDSKVMQFEDCSI